MIRVSWPTVSWPTRQTLLVAALVVAVLVLAGVGAWYWYSTQQQRAASAFAAAMARVQSARSVELSPDARAAAERDLESALQTYPSSAMAAQAAYELGNLRYADRQYAPARSTYEVALAKGATGTVRTLAKVGIAYTWESEHNFAKAAEAYQAAVADLRPTDPLYEQTLTDLARVQVLAGKKDDAIQTYRRVLKDVPRTPRGDEIRARLASLGATP